MEPYVAGLAQGAHEDEEDEVAEHVEHRHESLLTRAAFHRHQVAGDDQRLEHLDDLPI